MAHPAHKFPLLAAAYAASTVKAYHRAAHDFLRWLSAASLDPSTPDEYDDLLTQYIHSLYAAHQPRYKAVHAVYGIISMLPRLRLLLQTAKQALRGWGRLQPSESYPPLTWELTCAIAVRLLVNRHFPAAVATLLGFDCLLRVNEILSIRADDIADSKDARVSATTAEMTVRLRQTKTGRNQWVVVEDLDVLFFVRVLKRNAPSTDSRLFPYSDDTFRHLFHTACADLGLSSSYVPHSLRHGGATRMLVNRRPISDIMTRGRWSEQKSARRYIQSGRALLLSMSAPDDIQRAGLFVSRRLLLSFAVLLRVSNTQ